MITKTDTIIANIIFTAIREECGEEIVFQLNDKGTRRPTSDSLPTQMAIYFCNECFTGTTGRKDIASIFNAERTYVIYSEREIQKRLLNNRTFQYMMRRIASNIDSEITKLTDQ